MVQKQQADPTRKLEQSNISSNIYREPKPFSETETKIANEKNERNSNFETDGNESNHVYPAERTTATNLAVQQVHRNNSKATLSGSRETELENKKVNVEPSQQKEIKIYTASKATNKITGSNPNEQYVETSRKLSVGNHQEDSGERLQNTPQSAESIQQENEEDQSTKGKAKSDESSRSKSARQQYNSESSSKGIGLSPVTPLQHFDDSTKQLKQKVKSTKQVDQSFKMIQESSSEEKNDNASKFKKPILKLPKQKPVSRLKSELLTSGSGSNENASGAASDEVQASGASKEDQIKTDAQDLQGEMDALKTLKNYDKTFGFQFHGDVSSGETEADADFLSSGSSSGDFPDATFPRDDIPDLDSFEFGDDDENEDEAFDDFEFRSEIPHSSAESSSDADEQSDSSSEEISDDLTMKSNIPELPSFEFSASTDNGAVSSKQFEISRRSEIPDQSSGSGKHIGFSLMTNDNKVKSSKISGDSNELENNEMNSSTSSEYVSTSSDVGESEMVSQSSDYQERANEYINTDLGSSKDEISSGEKMNVKDDNQPASGVSLDSSKFYKSRLGNIVPKSFVQKKSKKLLNGKTSLTSGEDIMRTSTSKHLQETKTSDNSVEYLIGESGSGSGDESHPIMGENSGATENASVKSKIDSVNPNPIEDAIFDVGLPLSAQPSGDASGNATDHTTSVRKKTKAKKKLTLMEMLMKQHKLRAFKVSHPKIQVPGDVTNRGVVPKSDLGI